MSLYLETDQLETIQRILQLHFEGLVVYAYGARVSGVNLKPDSELNLAVVSDKPTALKEMVAVEKAFAESELPFSIDIVDWAKLPESIQKDIKKECVEIQGEK